MQCEAEVHSARCTCMYDASKAKRSCKRCEEFIIKVPPSCVLLLTFLRRFRFECADRIEDISNLTAVPGIGTQAVIKLAHHRGGGLIRNLEELIRQYKACKGEASTYEQDNAFYLWLKAEKGITHSRHDITLAVSTMVLKMERPRA